MVEMKNCSPNNYNLIVQLGTALEGGGGGGGGEVVVVCQILIAGQYSFTLDNARICPMIIFSLHMKYEYHQHLNRRYCS